MILVCKAIIVKYIKFVARYVRLVINICLICSLLPRVLVHNVKRVSISDKPHVLMVIDAFRTGGLERVLVDTYYILTEQGYNVSFLFCEKPTSGVMIIPPGVNIKAIGWGKPIKLVYEFTRHILREKPDIVYVGNPLMIAIASASKILLLGRMRLIVRVDNDYRAYGAALTRIDPDNAIPKQIRRLSWVLWVPNLVIIIEESLLDGIRKLSRFPVKLTCLRNPVDLDRIERMSWEDIDHPWTNGDFEVILSIGRLIPQKNQVMALRMFAILVGRRECARLVVIGNGRLRVDLETQARDLGIADRVHFTGNIPNPYSWMRRSNVLVVTSYNEGGPLVAIEAMACNLPVVSTDLLTMHDILENKELGEVVGIDDDIAMADAIVRVMDYSRDGLVDASKRYAISKHADGLCRILDEVLV